MALRAPALKHGTFTSVCNGSDCLQTSCFKDCASLHHALAIACADMGAQSMKHQAWGACCMSRSTVLSLYLLCAGVHLVTRTSLCWRGVTYSSDRSCSSRGLTNAVTVKWLQPLVVIIFGLHSGDQTCAEGGIIEF